MNPTLGWSLAALALLAGYLAYGMPGLILAASVIAFWLLLQFGQALRVMGRAARAPVGHVGSAVMLTSRLHAGMPLLQVLALTHSLGRRLDDPDRGESYEWRDSGGTTARLRFAEGKLQSWQLLRPPL